nr:uncharacterized protein LOC128671534 [Plodia interpunctella]
MLVFTLVLVLGVMSVRSDMCVKVFSGPVPPNAKPVNAQDFVLTPGTKDGTINYTPPCTGSALEVNVCDDVTPTVLVPSVYLVQVHRNGDANTAIILHSRFWCPNYPGAMKVVPLASQQPVPKPSRRAIYQESS